MEITLFEIAEGQKYTDTVNQTKRYRMRDSGTLKISTTEEMKEKKRWKIQKGVEMKMVFHILLYTRKLGINVMYPLLSDYATVSHTIPFTLLSHFPYDFLYDE